jgi:hypothetical protein
MERYIVIRQAYGRARYLSIVRAAIVEREAWTENRNMAERFDLLSMAEYKAKQHGRAFVVSALADLS